MRRAVNFEKVTIDHQFGKMIINQVFEGEIFFRQGISKIDL